MANYFRKLKVVRSRRAWASGYGWLLACIFIFVSQQFSAAAADAPTGRRSDDRQSDLIDALVSSAQFDEAESLCARYLDRSAQGSQAQATWTIRLSAVKAARLRSQAVEEPQRWVAAKQPVSMLREKYGSEPFAAWLQLQEALVDLAQGEVLAMRSIAKPQDIESLQQAEEVLRTATEDLQNLDNSLESTPAPGANGATTETSQLREIVRRKIIDSLLVRSTLYPSDSDDAIAAATEAELAAERLMEVTGFDSPMRETIVRTLAKARREAQDAKGAAEILRPWIGEDRYTDPATLAEWLLAEMQRGNNDAARQAFERYYGNDPVSAARSMEMDLARLKFLLSELVRSNASGGTSNITPSTISQWVEMIGARNGGYARRLAETEMLRGIRAKPTEGNLTLIVAKAGQLIRGGKPAELLEAALLLDEAVKLAAASDRQAEAFQFGLQAAAARAKAGQNEAAAASFASIAQRFPKEPQAAILHFEAAKLLSKLVSSASNTTSTNVSTVGDQAEAKRLIDALEGILLDQVRTWPSSSQAATARDWLTKIFEASSRYAEAAQVATSLPADSILWSDAIAKSGEYWRTAIDSAEDDSQRQAVAQTAHAQLSALFKTANEVAAKSNNSSSADRDDAGTLFDIAIRNALAGEANLIVGLVFDRQQIASTWISALGTEVEGGENEKGTDIQRFAEDLRQVRERSFDPNRLALDIPNATEGRKETGGQRIARLAIARLRKDATSTDEFRTVAGKAILRLTGTSVPESLEGQFNVAVALAWTGDWAEAATRIEAIAEAAKRSPNSGFTAAEALNDGASVLGGLQQPEAKRQAIALWNRLAAGTKAGGEPWHEAKLGAAQLLLELGDKEEAAKVARYVMLTKPPTTPELRARYESIAGQ